MKLKKIFFLFLIMLLIPYIIVHIFIREDEILFHFKENNTIRIKREKTGEIVVVPFEEYIVGVLAGEMPINFQMEALKAQAVAARSYALKKIEANRTAEYDIVDSTVNQVYLDEEYLKNAWKNTYVEKINKLRKAVLETQGEVLIYDNKIIEAFFFSTSVGATENSEDIFSKPVDYLRSVASLWDKDVSPVYTEKKTFSLKNFYQKLGLSYQESLNVETLEATSTGRTKKVKINGKTFTGSEVASLLNLRSAFFTIKKSENTVEIQTKGYGHGVGMSQYGAEGMARNGYSYDEILKYYYTGVEIKKI